jgi:hypothetical protein
MSLFAEASIGAAVLELGSLLDEEYGADIADPEGISSFFPEDFDLKIFILR